MKLQLNNYRTKIPKGIIYFFLVISGILIIFLCSLLQHVPAPMRGEYYYSTYFTNNYTLLAKALFFIFGILVGYFYQLNPWYSGICLNLIFPLTSIIEASVYRGSHNLIPVEFAFYLWLALPSIIAVYIGKFIFRQVTKQTKKAEGKNLCNILYIPANYSSRSFRILVTWLGGQYMPLFNLTTAPRRRYTLGIHLCLNQLYKIFELK